jgi:class 3 adenylate cyclase
MEPRMHRFTLAFDDPQLEAGYRASRSYRWRAFALATSVAVFIPWGTLAVWGYLTGRYERPIYEAVGLIVFPSTLLTLLVTRVVPASRRNAAVAIGAPTLGVVIALVFGLSPLRIGYDVQWFRYSVAAFSVNLLVQHTFTNARFPMRQLTTWFVIIVRLLAVAAVTPVDHLAAALGEEILWMSIAQTVGTYVSYKNERLSRRIFLERTRSERLLQNMLPGSIAERLKRNPGAIADHFDAVSVLFADIVGFTPLSEKLTPAELVDLLNRVFSAFDALVLELKLEKIKTIGDAYMVVAGVPQPRADHAHAAAELALRMREALTKIAEGKLALRIGINSGPVVAGVIGTTKYSYDLWGDTVNTASRMESHGAPHEIHVTDACRLALGDAFELSDRGTIDVKGKGPMRTFWLKGRRNSATSQAPARSEPSTTS